MCAVAACEPPGSVVFLFLFCFLIKETFLSFNVGRGWMAKNRMGQGGGVCFTQTD